MPNTVENLNVPNAITAVRLAGVAYEAIRYAQTDQLRHIFYAGGYLLLDVVDGPAARALHQETDFGAAFDPVVDKASFVAVTTAAALQHEVDGPVLAATALINISNAIATIVAKHRGVLDVHAVGKDNKRSQFNMNTGVGLNIIGSNLEKRSHTTIGRLAGMALRHSGTAIGITGALRIGLKATQGLWQKALSP